MDPVVKVTLSGSNLALDLLEDGVADQQPKYARILASHALKILDLPPADIHVRLAGVCSSELEEMFKEVIDQRLRQGGAAAEGAWACLLPLIGREVAWAGSTGDEHWPETPGEKIRVLGLEMAWMAGLWFKQRFERFGHQFSPRVIRRIMGRLRAKAPVWIQNIDTFWAKLIATRPIEAMYSRQIEVELTVGASSVRLLVDSVATPLVIDLSGSDAPDVNREWTVEVAGALFATSPSRSSLTQALESVAAVGGDPHLVTGPWPFTACVWSGDLTKSIELCKEGRFGDRDDWVAAETRWQSQGIGMDDLLHVTPEHCPFGPEVSQVGFPFAVCGFVFGGVTIEILEGYRRLVNVPLSREFLASYIVDNLMYNQGSTLLELKPGELRSMLGQGAGTALSCSWIDVLAVRELELNDWIEVLDEAGRHYKMIYVLHHRILPRSKEILETALRHDGGLQGIIRLVGSLILKGKSDPFDVDLRAEYYHEPKTRSAAIIIEVAQGRLDRKRAERLARITCEVERGRPGMVENVVEILSRLDVSGDTTDLLLVEILRLLDEDPSEPRSHVLRGLNGALRRRRSNLDDRRVWKALALPERLLEIVAE